MLLKLLYEYHVTVVERMKQFLSIVLLSVSLYMIHKLVYSEHGHTHTT